MEDEAKGGAALADEDRDATAGSARLPTGLKIILGLSLLGAIGLRIWLLNRSLGRLDADEAVVGLMARHVLEGEFPTFFWGGQYGGAQEAYLTSLAFAAFGSSTLVLKMI